MYLTKNRNFILVTNTYPIDKISVLLIKIFITCSDTQVVHTTRGEITIPKTNELIITSTAITSLLATNSAQKLYKKHQIITAKHLNKFLPKPYKHIPALARLWKLIT